MAKPKICPECDHEFQGKGFEGVDAHWRAWHHRIMSYEKARVLILTGQYKRSDKKKSREDVNQAAARIVRESTED